MGTAKAWYFAALGVVALSFGSSTGRCLFGKASNAIDQFRARTVPYVAMLEMTLGHPQNTPQVQATVARVQETVARVEAQKACAQARMARIQAMRDRMEARRAAQLDAAADQDQDVLDETMAVSDRDWSKMASLPGRTVAVRKALIANRSLASVQAWKQSQKFMAPYVRFTPNQIVIEGPHGIVVAPRGNLNAPSFPVRAMEQMDDPI
jgi:hypothetical protein